MSKTVDVTPFFVFSEAVKVSAERNSGTFFIFRGAGAGTVQLARRRSGQMVRVFCRFRGQNVTGNAGRVFEVDVSETFPAAENSGDLCADRVAAVHHGLDDRIQPAIRN